MYCLADPFFYDSPHNGQSAAEGFVILDRPLPDGWQRIDHGEWRINVPPGCSIPAQGWKIHVSASGTSAGSVLDRVWDYCVPRRIWFKFLRGPLALHMRNAKYAPRGGSGKLVTIYPVDDAACELILGELGRLLDGTPGPYILSDLRYGDGPLYVRYGGFSERHCRDSAGELVPAVEDPSGKLVPDERSPVFTVPPWVRLPGFLAPHLAARNGAGVADLPYRVDGALHFSNGGGVYTATDAGSGERVVLKEARPYAGLSADGADAVTRLRREHDVLKRLSGLDTVPAVRGYFEAGTHHFLVQEFIEGTPLNACYAERYPLRGLEPDPAAIADYTAWALRVCAGVQGAVDAIHDRGVVINDLHMFNIMVRPDDSVALIDFEAAAGVEEGMRPVIGNPGFVAPRDRTGFDIDAYSLACVRLAMFMPLTTLFALDRGKAAQIAEVIAAEFPVPPGFLEQAVSVITGEGLRPLPAPRLRPVTGVRMDGAIGERYRPAGPDRRDEPRGPARTDPAAGPGWAHGECSLADWEQARDGLAGAILASATPARDDRLFPGDIDQFAGPGGGLGLAHGAAGVLYALSAAGVRVQEHEDWLIARTLPPPAGMRLGLYDGLMGVAWLLDRLGHRDAALQAADACLAERWERLGPGLYGGLSGIALALLSLADATGETSLRDAGLRAADIVADSMARWPESATRPAGLLRGASGPALLFIRMYERTADTGFLDLAAAALAADLDRCVPDSAGSLQVDEGWRILPYLGGGSAGIGIVLDGYLALDGVHANSRLAEAAGAIPIAACSAFYAQSGLFNGRAGMLLYLARRQFPGAAAGDPHAAAHVRRLAWHAIRYRNGVAFPGDQLFRLSMDLGTGTAGVLLGLAAALAPSPASLPFLATDLPGRPSQGQPEPRTEARR